MITITNEPFNTPTTGTLPSDPKGPPVPVTDCFQWSMQLDADDIMVTNGTNAELVVTFPASTSVVSPGSSFKIWGKTFTVNNSINFSGTEFRTSTLGRTTASNFYNMLLSNLFFSRTTSITLQDLTTSFVVTVTWNECREQSNFTTAGMEFAALELTGATVSYTNGVSPEYVDGVKIVTQLVLVDELTDKQNLTELEAYEPDRLCDGAGEVSVNMQRDIAAQVYTILPELSSDSFTTATQNGQSLMKTFQLRYGWVYRDNCVSQSGTFLFSNYVVAINAAFPKNDPHTIRRYWYNHPDGFPSGQTVQKFLTTQPKGIRLCRDSYAWLWMTNNFSETDGNNYDLRATVRVYVDQVLDGTYLLLVNDGGTDGNNWYEPVCFSVSPLRIRELRSIDPSIVYPVDAFNKYEVEVNVISSGGTVIRRATETLIYQMDDCECGSNVTELYFLTPAGGYGTLPVEILDSSDNREGVEVDLYQPCEWDFEQRNKHGGRTLVNLRNYKRMTVRAKALGNSQAERSWFSDFVLSPVKHIRQTVDGVDVPCKCILDTGTVQIYDINGQSEMTATIYLQDIGVQTPANQ